jgi:hypothetical protein
MSPVDWGVILIVAAITLFIVGWLPTVRSIMIFVGILAVGLGGHLTHLLASAMVFISGLFGIILAWAFGVTVTIGFAAVLVALGIFIAHQWHPKNKAGRGATFAAAALALLIVGGVGVAQFSGLTSQIQQGISQTTSQVGG